MSFYYRVMGPKDADGMANRVDPDQEQPDLVYTFFPGLSVRKLRHTCDTFEMTNREIFFFK